MAEGSIRWGEDPGVVTTKEIGRIQEIALRHRDELVEELEEAFPGGEAMPWLWRWRWKPSRIWG
jgi:hypothetical protein